MKLSLGCLVAPSSNSHQVEVAAAAAADEQEEEEGSVDVLGHFSSLGFSGE